MMETISEYLPIIKKLMFGLFIGIGIFLGRYLKDFLLWMKGGVENQDGKLDNKDLQIVYASFIVAFITITTFFGANYPESMIYASYTLLGTLYGVKVIWGEKK